MKCLDCDREHGLCNDCGEARVAHRRDRDVLSPASYCRPCQNKRSRASRKKRPDHYQRQNRLLEVRTRYGLTEAELDSLGDACHLCGEPAKCIDHCHATGKVRGLLCARCNTALGLMRDDPDLLRRAAHYTENGGTVDANPQCPECQQGKTDNCALMALHPVTDELVECTTVAETVGSSS